MPKAEVDRRVVATAEAIRQDAAGNGLYFRLWRPSRQKTRRSRRSCSTGSRAKTISPAIPSVISCSPR